MGNPYRSGPTGFALTIFFQCFELDFSGYRAALLSWFCASFICKNHSWKRKYHWFWAAAVVAHKHKVRSWFISCCSITKLQLLMYLTSNLNVVKVILLFCFTFKNILNIICLCFSVKAQMFSAQTNLNKTVMAFFLQWVWKWSLSQLLWALRGAQLDSRPIKNTIIFSNDACSCHLRWLICLLNHNFTLVLLYRYFYYLHFASCWFCIFLFLFIGAIHFTYNLRYYQVHFFFLWVCVHWKSYGFENDANI